MSASAGDASGVHPGAGAMSAERAEGAVRTAPTYRFVHLWHTPLRVMHWVAALAVVALVVTGFYIGKPYFVTHGEASSHYLMGTMRFIHFLSAAILVTTGIFRLYGLFVGNRYERWKALFPFQPRDWGLLWRQLKAYALIRPERAPHFLGHNPLQQLSYTGIYVVAAAMVVTGFYMYGLSNPGGFFYVAFRWVGGLLGGAQAVRFWHHVLSWVFIIFLPVHIYFAVRADVTEREGSISSMINGGKFVREDLEYVDE